MAKIADGEIYGHSYGSGFTIPVYAFNVYRRPIPPRDVFYFEIAQDKLREFRKASVKFSRECKHTPSALEDYAAQFKGKFDNPFLCYEKNDGKAIAYETLVVGRENGSVPVFYAYWGN